MLPDPFVRAIIASPYDDLPRLIAADWLEERGQVERAEFIRVQVARSNGSDVSFETRQREGRLWIDHASTGPNPWFPGIAHATGGPKDEFRFQFFNRGGAAVVSRGFISRIECTLAQFMGGVCERCGGRGMSYILDKDGRRIGGGVSTWSGPTRGGWPIQDCPDCNGTGRTPGLVDTLFWCQPIEAVTITDREPYRAPFQHATGLVITWTAWTDQDYPSNLPSELRGQTNMGSAFPTREAALGAISRACVTLGRKRAGLPPI
jgi:uncharacterized protein (TIGR02996 family)